MILYQVNVEMSEMMLLMHKTYHVSNFKNESKIIFRIHYSRNKYCFESNGSEK